MTVPADVLLGDRYRLLERLAGGGMGEVWRGRDEVLGRTVAVKLLREDYAGDPAFLARFRAEARTAAALSHPGIAQVFDYGEAPLGPGSGGAVRPFIVMELVAGEPLSATLAREGRLPADRAMAVVAETATALQAAHDAGTVHRDVKPANVMLQPDGQVKVTDFGIARAAHAAPLTQVGTVVGTAHYLSPEQAAGQPVTPASDIYSLGVVAYECLAGERPFPGDNPVAVALAHVREAPPPLPADVPPGARDLVDRMLAKDPADRPATAAEVAALAAQATAPRTPTYDGTRVLPVTATLPATPARGRRRPPLLALALVAALLLLAGIALAARDTGGRPAATPTAGRTPAPSTSAPRTVRLDASDYVGRPYLDVARELRALGLQVAPAARTVAEPRPGTVADVRPEGTVTVGSTVTVTVARAPTPAPAPARDKGKGDKQKGKGHDDD